VMFKPFGVEDLVRKIDTLLAKRSNGVKPSMGAATSATAPAPVVPSLTGPPFTPAPAPRSASASAPMPLSAPATTPAPAAFAPSAHDQSLKQRLQSLAGTPGVRFVVLTDREGFLIETAGDLAPDADEVAGALASCLAEASDGIGRELGQGQLVGTILEYEAGTLLLHGVGPSALLAVLVRDQGVLGKVRYYVRKIVPELARAL
jgi:predicted regulator of Ras-like GTPase activity (Roadblock/LC7/MglB family)